MTPDSFFNILVYIGANGEPYLDRPIICGPYLSLSEAAAVMMDGLRIILDPHWDNLMTYTEVHVQSEVIEYFLYENNLEILGCCAEDSRTLRGLDDLQDRGVNDEL